jgi:pre-mRNA-splicing helicase BRR2
MAEDHLRNKIFEYKANSNLVLQADRGKRRGDEPTGEVESLWGKTRGMKMGDRIDRDRSAELEKKIEKAKVRREKNRDAEEEKKEREAKRQRQGVFIAGRGATVLTETQDMDSINYRPKTRESRAAYEEMLAYVQGRLGAQPQDILRGAAEEVLSLLKDESMNDRERHKEVDVLLKSVPAEDFARLVSMGKRINDFSANDAEEKQRVDADEGGPDGMDEDMGVAVVFDEDEDGDDQEDGVDEVRDSEDEDEDVGGDETTATRALKGRDAEDGDGGDEEEAGKLGVHDVDAHWLQRGISRYYDDANVSAKLAEDVLSVLGLPEERTCENKLVILLDYDKFDFIKLLLRNRWAIFHLTRLRQAQSDDEREAIQAEMAGDVAGGGPALLLELSRTESASSWNQDRIAAFGKNMQKEARALARGGSQESQGGVRLVDEGEETLPRLPSQAQAPPQAVAPVDLEAMAFADGGHTMTNKTCELPEGAWRAQKKGYEEVHVPAVRHVPPKGEKLVSIAELPPWCQPAFEGMEKLNRIQSRMQDAALLGSENLLLCAPTGAGKTNVAMLCMLHEIGQRIREDGSLDLDSFKIVYVAPMKALVQEVVANFGRRLQSFGITVRELSGDVSLSRQEIQETQVIVTTPEKWDIITRKAGDRTFTQLVRLVIIDEIHLLHDDRGPVLEALVARIIRQVEATQEMVRIVGLSATLPNYEDVAAFLRVPPDRGLFYFDNSFRPVPLQQQYIGITEKKAIKRFSLMNELCYEKVMAQAGRNQVLIFVHSRSETVKTARAIRDMCVENDTLGSFIKEGSASSEILRTEAENAQSEDLKDLLAYGFAIHHAGMSRADRNLVEDLYGDKHAQVLVSTATLAWGVNLPAHTVILKGTQMYSPDKGDWVELSPLDVLQMMGRAGRPQYDTEGEGIILTLYSQLQYYLSLNNQQLPVESQLIKRLPDQLNAEIVLGTVANVQDAVNWLGYTYLYVRLLRAPEVYGVPEGAAEGDPSLRQFRTDMVYEAAAQLEKTGLIKFDRRGGSLQSTALGRVASYFYIAHQSMAKYNDSLKPVMSQMELIRAFTLSEEFRLLHVREEEKPEMRKLSQQVPYPIKDSPEEKEAKVNVLLQAYIGRYPLDGFALNSDMVYVTQSASRILRALFEMAIKRGWADLAGKALTLCKLVERRVWESMSPLRQFKGIPDVLVKKLERKNIPWARYLDLRPADLGELIKNPRMGKQLHALIHQFPRLELSATVQPITRSLLRVELEIRPDFKFDPKVHEPSMLFHILVEDVDGINILHHEAFLLSAKGAEREHILSFVVPIADPPPPQYFVKAVSDRWLHSEAVLPISFRHLLLPAKQPPYTELLDLQPLPLSALSNGAYERLYAGTRSTFNPIQTQAFGALYEGDSNVLLCAPEGSDRIVGGEFALLRLWAGSRGGTAVYVAPRADLVNLRMTDWRKKFAALGKNVVQLTGETSTDLQLLEVGDLVIATAEQWDMLSRRWRQRKAIQTVALFIVDELQLMGGEGGPVVEVVTSRMRYIASQMEQQCRIVALSASLANARDVGDWIGATSHNLLNFHPAVRPIPLELRLQSFDINHFGSRMLAMAKPAYHAVAAAAASSKGSRALVFVPSRKQTQLTAIDFIAYAAAEGNTYKFVGEGEGAKSRLAELSQRFADAALQQTLQQGVAFIHAGMTLRDRTAICELFSEGSAMVLVVHQSLCWSMDIAADVAVIMGTEAYNGKEQRFTDYAIADLLRMVGMAGRADGACPSGSGRCHILCHTPKKAFLKRVLDDALPIESHLDHCLADHLNAEVVTKTVESKQDAVDYLTWTFFYRRLSKNPNYYNMAGTGNQHLSDHLSELVEQTVTDLEEARCVAVEDDMNLSALNLGMIAAYYYIQYTTVELFANSLTAKTKQRGLLDIISSASEFSSLPLRQKEDRALEMLAKHLPQKLPHDWSFAEPPAKAHVLLQSHFSRRPLGSDLKADQALVVRETPRLISAAVDVISSSGWLKPALEAMELSQMAVQGVWSNDSYLKQLPHFTEEIIARCEKAGVESPFDIMDLEDDDRDKLLQLPERLLADVAQFCNSFPNVEMSYSVLESDDIATGDAVSVVVTLEKESDEEEKESSTRKPEPAKVVAPLFPKEKAEGWWLVVGSKSKNTLLAIKRVLLTARARTKLEFLAPEEAGEHELVLLLMSDSYAGCDQEYTININVKEGGGDYSEDEDADMEEA